MIIFCHIRCCSIGKKDFTKQFWVFLNIHTHLRIWEVVYGFNHTVTDAS